MSDKPEKEKDEMNEKKVSLWGIPFEEAVKGLLETGPMPSKKKKRKKAKKDKEPSDES